MVLDRLYHDDGVVDHDADRQHEGEGDTVLAEKPSASIAAKVPMSETGTAISGMRVARTLPRKRYTTMTTSAKASSRVLTTSWMLSSTKTVVS